ncbi:hypothetical protein [Paenibacillus faecis]|uniref:hypothetical protein n=1 Tax=Paenibacillus faecis TaxID=862114 RepID=UPI00147935C3|nr:hypothetical protein [Paenibacillus faecis]
MNIIEKMVLFLRTEAYAKANNRMKVAEWARQQYRKNREMYFANWGGSDVGRSAS